MIVGTEADFVTPRSATAATAVVAIPASLPGTGSGVALDAVAVAGIDVPIGTPASTWTVTVRVADAPAASDAVAKSTVPAAPTAGAMTLHPGGAEAATKV